MNAAEDPRAPLRRMIRSIVQAVVALALVALLWWLTDLLADDREGLKLIAKGALAITGLGTLFYGMENTTRAFNFALGKDGVKFGAGSERRDAIRSGDEVTVEKVQ